MSRPNTASGAARARNRPPATLFAALGDETRLQLLQRLSTHGPESIARLAAPPGARPSVSRQAITKHLRVLAAAGFVRGQRRGREHIWELQPRRLDEAGAHLARIARQWDMALGRLRAFVEAPD